MKDSARETNKVESTNHGKSADKNSHNNQLTENGDDLSGTISENRELSGQKTKHVTPHVKQNFSEINVELEYTGDDIKPLEESSEEDEDNTFVESESEDELENDEEEEDQDGDVKNEEQEDIRAAYGKPETE